MPQLSVILPFHNESDGIHRLLHQLYPALGKLDLSYEIICVDDGSSDNTFTSLIHERQFDHRLKIVRLARKFGKETALTCGLQLAKGDVAITMDGNFQHPPEIIPELAKKWREGFEVVHAVRIDRHADSGIHSLFSRLFYAVFRRVADVQIPEGAGDFCLYDRKAIDAINALPERNRFMKGLASWVGFRQSTVPFEAGSCKSVRSKWETFRLLCFAFDGLSSFSSLPLRLWIWCGTLISLAAIAYALLLVIDAMLFGVDVPGQTSLMVGILFLGGLQLLSLGMIGEYMARIFTEVKARPLYFISEKVGFE